VQSFRGAREPVLLSDSTVETARALARAEGTTLFQVLLAAFHVLVSRYAATTDLVVGTPVAGRTQGETEGLVGFFANVLPLRTDLSGDPGFREVLRRTRESVMGAWEHQDAPFEKVVEAVHPGRALGHAPLFQVSFALESGEVAAPVLEGVRVERMEVDRPTARWDLEVALAEDGPGVRGYAAYATDLFQPATVRRMMDHLARVVEQCVAEPDVRASRVELLDADERRAVLDLAADTDADVPPGEACIHHLFEAQAARTPNADALLWEREVVTYAELNARANRLAHHLAARGVGPESRVGVCLERGPELVVALLAVLKAGGAYVPLDPAYPAERLAATLAGAGARLLVTQQSLRRLVPAPDAAAVCVDGADRAAIEASPDVDPAVPVAPRNLAYLIHTSGSTGAPKGVAVEHASAAALLAWGARAWSAAELGGRWRPPPSASTSRSPSSSCRWPWAGAWSWRATSWSCRAFPPPAACGW
jgi:non-ribosomal peptide synthetase component F